LATVHRIVCALSRITFKAIRRKEKFLIYFVLAFAFVCNTNESMSTETDATEVVVTFRIPSELRQKVERRRKGRFATVSEYVRDLIRKDTDEVPSPAEGAVSPDSETKEVA
jgi:hypothetical protein